MERKKRNEGNVGIGIGIGILHEKIERKVEGLEVGDEASNRIKRAEVESHDSDLRAGALLADPSSSLLRRLHIPSREDQPRAALRQHSSCLRSDS